MNNILLVHGAFVDGAHWERVYEILKRDGYSVSVVQSPTISLEDDVSYRPCPCNAERPCDSRRPLLRRSGDH